MDSDHDLQKNFYQNLGKLFYAVAAADRILRQEEVEALKQIVNTEWLGLAGTRDKSELDALRQIKIIFFQLNEESRKPNDCLADFKSFKEAHEDLFAHDVKQLIWKTAMVLAESFSRRNKSELILLAELDAILKHNGK